MKLVSYDGEFQNVKADAENVEYQI